MEELKRAIQAMAAEGAATPSVSVALQPKAGATMVLEWVNGYFRESPSSVLEIHIHRARPNLKSLSVRVTGDSVARAMRSPDFRAFAASFGDSGYGTLTGQPRYRTRKYKCPKCGREVNGIPLDGVPPPTCMNNHPPRHMTLD